MQAEVEVTLSRVLSLGTAMLFLRVSYVVSGLCFLTWQLLVVIHVAVLSLKSLGERKMGLCAATAKSLLVCPEVFLINLGISLLTRIA